MPSSSSIYHNSIGSHTSGAGIMASNMVMTASINGATDPLLRGGAGLHRCDVCECCMTAGAMAQHQSGRKHLRRLAAIANGTLRPSAHNGSSDSGSDDGSVAPGGDARVVAWRRFHHCTDCNLWLYWREKERHENGARHRATVAAAARRAETIPSLSITTASARTASPISHMGSASYASHHGMHDSYSDNSRSQQISPPPSTAYSSSPPRATRQLAHNWTSSRTYAPHHDSRMDHMHHEHHNDILIPSKSISSGMSQSIGSGNTSDTPMGTFLSFVTEYDGAGTSHNNGWSLFANDAAPSSSSSAAAGADTRGTARANSLPASPSTTYSHVTPSAVVASLGTRSSSAPTSPSLLAGNNHAAPRSHRSHHRSQYGNQYYANNEYNRPSSSHVSSHVSYTTAPHTSRHTGYTNHANGVTNQYNQYMNGDQAVSYARHHHVRRSASSDSVPVPTAALSTPSSSVSSSSMSAWPTNTSPTYSGSSSMSSSSLWSSPSVSTISSKSLPVATMSTSVPSYPMKPVHDSHASSSSSSMASIGWQSSRTSDMTSVSPSSSSSSQSSPLAAVAPHHRRAAGNGHLVYTQQPVRQSSPSSSMVASSSSSSRMYI